MGKAHEAAIQWKLTPQNWSGNIEVRSALDGNVINHGVKRYRQLNSQHLEHMQKGALNEDAIYLQVRSVQSHVEIAQAARTRAFTSTEELKPKRKTLEKER